MIFTGSIEVGSAFAPQTWHAHEMIFGYTAAVIAGFLLTAVSNWTKRETLVGAPLIGLCALWLLARILLVHKALAPAAATASVDVLFLPALALAIARPLVASGNRRNFVMVTVLLALASTNALMHLDALGWSPGMAKEPMLWILHGGHAWLAVSMLLKALSIAVPRLASSSTHALTAGAIGWLSMGMMARVSLGHTGRLLTATRSTRLAFALLGAATTLRVVAPLVVSEYVRLVILSGVLWTLAFAVFLLEFAPVWWRPRVDGKPG